MESENTKAKMKFNRRAYLKQKLRGKFGSQQEGHGQAFLQKKAVVRQHFRLQKRMQAKERKKLHNLQNTCQDGSMEASQISPTDTTEDSPPLSPFLRRNRPNNLRRAKAEYKKKTEEKQQREEEVVRRKQEAEAARKRYKEKRLHRFKKLCQKTRTGQPVMRGKIEMMLESLQQAAHT